ncbi:hypothetical protein OG896_24905 [Streptomyces sp. NBC_00669]|uniref:hypothetical protein n=1 Tax=Streptomyces sp. NBC_00669 TaxID=2976011 RepID=UPI002E378B9A|nr:hypothetical protein [Streptomyces sp. NBC_00669]
MTTAERDRLAAELAEQQAAREVDRRQLATALDQPSSRPWPDLIAMAGANHAAEQDGSET